mgnify:CR=1 FL=1
MDWQKTIGTVGEVARKTFTLALALVLIMTSVSGVYIAALAIWWIVKKAQEALGA